MYEHFFGFVKKPFNLTPDTALLYPSSQHEEVIQTLAYAIENRRGFMMLTGEVGTGKTTSIRALLNRLGSNVQTSVILNPLVSTVELLQCINKDFGCQTTGQSIQAQLDALNYFVLENFKEGRNTVVIIDESQNLSTEALEMTRLLSNLETETDKLLQIILVGQPELEEKLAQKNLRQLAQRIQIYCHLKPLDEPETINYVQHRLNRSGQHITLAFEKSALRELHKISRGIPRIINTVCEFALLAAYAKDTRVITRPIIREAAKEAPQHVHHS